MAISVVGLAWDWKDDPPFALMETHILRLLGTGASAIGLKPLGAGDGDTHRLLILDVPSDTVTGAMAERMWAAWWETRLTDEEAGPQLPETEPLEWSDRAGERLEHE